ncbi:MULTISPECIES: cyclase family protein [unclassified Sphingomonas]|uniref:cyclase family protein n=1 Tax=unclassified Sphingomonas TaxID=196159 RepID=UPI0006FE7A5E|nr:MULTISPECIES: cyclase family protein [unclassified Sphingomonas]KQM66251.1 cyclase [Sphingomonas sp. Leaf16]KQN08707.1 cyclase [Sphingomonas sp. Leaf29]KQN17287.1 cyclase [Sphingomonas sp. Leaf32]
MTRRIIDLSIAIDPEVVTDPPFMRPTITRQNHAGTVAEAAMFFPGITADKMAGGEGFAASETLTLSTHNGTHLDAPWHYHPTMDAALGDGGKPALTIDEVPLDWCLRPGLKLDFRHLPDGHVVTAAEVEAELSRIGHTLQPLDIVLVNTAAGAALGRPDFLGKGCGMGYDATMYLTRQGVRVTGTDAWSWDAPFSHTAAKVAETGDYALVWEGHKAGRDIGYCHMEKLTNLDQLPATGFTVSCLPVKVKGGSAGWCRAVAFLEDGE